MKYELTSRQKELLKYIDSYGTVKIEPWMWSQTTAALKRRGAIKMEVLKSYVKLAITPHGRFLLDFVPEDYYEILTEIKKWRK